MEYFPELILPCPYRDALVADLRIVSNDVIHWDISFMWTQSPLSSMSCILLGCVGEEMISYVGCTQKNLFEFKSFYKVLSKC
jgi:hypothetical protein